MKKSIIIALGILVSLVSISLNAQQLPKTGAALKLSNNTVEVNNGQSINIEIQRLRSKSYTKAKFGSILVNAPKDMTAIVKIDEANQDLFVVILTPSENMKAGKYTLTVQGEGRNASKVKATMLSVIVSEQNNQAKPSL
jgi:uncharacterized membrane protein